MSNLKFQQGQIYEVILLQSGSPDPVKATYFGGNTWGRMISQKAELIYGPFPNPGEETNQFTYSVTKGTSRDFSASIGVAVSADFKLFGVGVGVEVSSTVTFSKSSFEQDEIGVTLNLKPGMWGGIAQDKTMVELFTYVPLFTLKGLPVLNPINDITKKTLFIGGVPIPLDGSSPEDVAMKYAEL